MKKASGKWRNCFDYTNLNKAYLKDSYPLLNINKLVDDSVISYYISWTEHANYQYNVMPFRLKNVVVIYHRMIKKICQEEIVEKFEVYTNDMIIESIREGFHAEHLQRVFKRVQQYNMRLT